MAEHKRKAIFVLAAIAVVGLIVLLGVAARNAVRSRRPDWGAPEAAKNAANPVAPTEENLAAAKSLYTNNCAQCHGAIGKGDGGDAGLYNPAPGDLTQGHMNDMKDGEIFWKITNGRIPMPGFEKRLTDQQRWQLVNYMRELSAPGAAEPQPK